MRASKSQNKARCSILKQPRCNVTYHTSRQLNRLITAYGEARCTNILPSTHRHLHNGKLPQKPPKSASRILEAVNAGNISVQWKLYHARPVYRNDQKINTVLQKKEKVRIYLEYDGKPRQRTQRRLRVSCHLGLQPPKLATARQSTIVRCLRAP